MIQNTTFAYRRPFYCTMRKKLSILAATYAMRVRSEYDLKMPQSHKAEHSMAQRRRDTEHLQPHTT